MNNHGEDDNRGLYNHGKDGNKGLYIHGKDGNKGPYYHPISTERMAIRASININTQPSVKKFATSSFLQACVVHSVRNHPKKV